MTFRADQIAPSRQADSHVAILIEGGKLTTTAGWDGPHALAWWPAGQGYPTNVTARQWRSRATRAGVPAQVAKAYVDSMGEPFAVRRAVTAWEVEQLED